MKLAILNSCCEIPVTRRDRPVASTPKRRDRDHRLSARGTRLHARNTFRRTCLAAILLVCWSKAGWCEQIETQPLTGGAEEHVVVTPAPRPNAEKTCVELYLEITELLDGKTEAQAGFWTDQKNQVAGAAGTVFKPAWLYLGYAAVQHFQTTQKTSNSTQQIRELRMASADKRCFVK